MSTAHAQWVDTDNGYDHKDYQHGALLSLHLNLQ